MVDSSTYLNSSNNINSGFMDEDINIIKKNVKTIFYL